MTSCMRAGTAELTVDFYVFPLSPLPGSTLAVRLQVQHCGASCGPSLHASRPGAVVLRRPGTKPIFNLQVAAEGSLTQLQVQFVSPCAPRP